MVPGVEDLDRQIVRLLAADGRRSYTDLARDTGLSVSALHQRVRRLEKRGVIRGYRADVDSDEVGLPLTAFVSIKPIDPAAPVPRTTSMAGVEGCSLTGSRRGPRSAPGFGDVAAALASAARRRFQE